jgi:hypothetical protein
MQVPQLHYFAILHTKGKSSSVVERLSEVHIAYFGLIDFKSGVEWSATERGFAWQSDRPMRHLDG